MLYLKIFFHKGQLFIYGLYIKTKVRSLAMIIRHNNYSALLSPEVMPL